MTCLKWRFCEKVIFDFMEFLGFMGILWGSSPEKSKNSEITFSQNLNFFTILSQRWQSSTDIQKSKNLFFMPFLPFKSILKAKKRWNRKKTNHSFVANFLENNLEEKTKKIFLTPRTDISLFWKMTFFRSFFPKKKKKKIKKI